MNRRKSVVQSSGGGITSEKKHRSPFAAFKRADSAREMQIPESAPEEGYRSETAVTTQGNINEPVRAASESFDHGRPDQLSTSPERQPTGAATNGSAYQEMHGDSGLVNLHTGEVRGKLGAD